MEKVNIQFHDNYTVTYQHKKILQFVPELSVDKDLKLTTPNIPLLVNRGREPANLNCDANFITITTNSFRH